MSAFYIIVTEERRRTFFSDLLQKKAMSGSLPLFGKKPENKSKKIGQKHSKLPFKTLRNIFNEKK